MRLGLGVDDVLGHHYDQFLSGRWHHFKNVLGGEVYAEGEVGWSGVGHDNKKEALLLFFAPMGMPLFCGGELCVSFTDRRRRLVPRIPRIPLPHPG